MYVCIHSPQGILGNIGQGDFFHHILINARYGQLTSEELAREFKLIINCRMF